MAPTVFALPAGRAAKADPALVARDEQHLGLLAEQLGSQRDAMAARLDALRRAPGGSGQEALERDLDIHRTTGRLRLLRRFGLDLCLGRMVVDGDPDPVYVGRLGLSDGDGGRLLLDWRAPAAEPFFAATHGDPHGLASRRRYRWVDGRIVDYWDEVFVADALEGHAALDDQSAFIASLGATRSPRMRDVVATIQADQDAIVRAGSRGALVVDGGPGTGKTVVALHRAAYLLHADARIARSGAGSRQGGGHGGVLLVGPTPTYLAFVADVLPSLGEDGVRSCTLRDLVPEGASVEPEADADVADLKASRRLVEAVDALVRLYELPPRDAVAVRTPWGRLQVDAPTWAEAFASVDAGTAHDDAHDEIWQAMAEIVAERLTDLGVTDADGDDVDPALLERTLRQDETLADALTAAWPTLDPEGVVESLWSSAAMLRRCAPWLDDDEVALLQRADAGAWTASDLPFLDAARRRVGDPETAQRTRRRAAAVAAERDRRESVADELIAADDSELHLMSMLRGTDLQGALDEEGDAHALDPDLLAGPFAHIVVDEAQELTDAEWTMLLSRCPSRSLTIVGDRAQARRGFPEPWEERLARVGVRRVEVASLRVGYRTPKEVMAEAEPIIRRALPDANVPESVRSGEPVLHASVGERDAIVDAWLAEHEDGVACVIGDPTFAERPRVRSLRPEQAKGLEFDLVVLVDAGRPGEGGFGDGLTGAVDRYVAMTRTTQRLVVLRA